jgi:DnaK suppressor protein
LESRWLEELQEVTQLSIAYDDAAHRAAADGDRDQSEPRRVLREAVAARRRLANIDDALHRVSDGKFGACEQCGSAIDPGRLGQAPETRYCAACAD